MLISFCKATMPQLSLYSNTYNQVGLDYLSMRYTIAYPVLGTVTHLPPYWS